MRRTVSLILFFVLFVFFMFSLTSVFSEPLSEQDLKFVRLGSHLGKPLVWRVLRIEGDEALLLANEVLTIRKMHESQKTYKDYASSDLYLYLTGAFLEEIFFEEEKKAILEINLPSSELIRKKEFGFKSDKNRVFPFSEAALAQSAKAEGIWLSTAPKKHKDYMFRTYGNGKIGYSSVQSLLGVLPVLRLNMSGAKWELGEGTAASPAVLSLTTPGILRMENEEKARVLKELAEKERIEKEEREKEEKRLLQIAQLEEEKKSLEDALSSAKEGEQANISAKIEAVQEKINALLVTVIEGFPTLNHEGFLEKGEFVHIDDEGGQWRFANRDTRIDLRKYTEKRDKNGPVVYFIADVKVKEHADGLHIVPNQEDFPPDYHRARLKKQADIAKNNDLVLAINTDYYVYRTNRKDLKCGIVIRNGRVIVDDPVDKEKQNFPPYHYLMIMNDGSFEVRKPGSLSSADMLAMGAKHVFTFGPYLINKGVINEEYKGKYGHHFNSRVAIGVKEKGHYIILVSEGRLKESAGFTLWEVAEILKERGCETAFNLDGGQTSFIGFMGKQLNKMYALPNPYISRPQSEVMGFGRSNWMKENKR